MQPVTLLDYQASWARAFDDVSAELATLFKAGPVQIEHIGSTAVPGLCAKPVIDILLGAQHLDIIRAQAVGLAGLGYLYRPAYEVEIPARRYFVRPQGPHPRIHLHAVVQGGALWLNHLTFREALRESSTLSGQYASLKKQLAARHGEDKAAYTAAKAPFILQVLAGRGTA